MPLPHAPDLVSTILLDGRLPALLTGIVLLCFGARVYRLLILAPGVIAGVYLGAFIGEIGHMAPAVVVGITVALAVAGALPCYFVEGVARRVGGAGLFAALTAFAWPLVSKEPAHWWVPVVGGVVGALVFPKLYQFLLRPTTALVGAWSIAWAVKHEKDIWLIGGLAIAGTVVQFWLGEGKGEPAAAAKKEKPKKKG